MRLSEPVNRLMTQAVLSIDVSAPPSEILRYFAEYPVHHLPVVDKNVVVGMLSSADVLKLEAFLPKTGDPVGFLNRRFNIEQIMRRPPITIGSHAAVEQAAALMAKHGIHALPVVTEQDHLLGIITTTDVINAALQSEAPPENRSNDDASEAQAKQSPAQIAHAVKCAAAHAGSEGDLGALARALLHTHARAKTLEEVLACAERYVRAGQDERLHTALVQAIEKARASAGGTAPVLGL